jgi:hypothetical protein
MRRLYLFLLLTVPILLHAQDLTGIWQGHFRSTGTMRSSIYEDRYRFEVQIAQHNKSFEGVTYSYLSTFFYGKAAAAGTISVRTQKVMLQEGKLLEVRNSGTDVCIMTCFLQYSRSGDEEFLEGTYVSMNVRDSSNCGRGTVFLRKVPTSDFYTEPFVAKREKEIAADSAHPAHPLAGTMTPPTRTMPARPTTPARSRPLARATPPAKKPEAAPGKPAAGTPAKTPAAGTTAKTTPHKKPAPSPEPTHKSPPMARVMVPSQTMRQPPDSGSSIGRKFPTIVPPVIKDRQNEVVKTLTVNSTEVTLRIYDDGAIDHDTVSVYLDNKPVLLHRMLTDRPLIVNIHLDANDDYHEIVMVADNEGDIPPNTSLMIVSAGDKEYKVNISSTEQKNAVVRFQYVK